MPELPDVTVYREALERFVGGEVLERIRLGSPFVLRERLRAAVGDGIPEKVTAFHPEMAVHGKFGEPCPRCGSAVQRIVYAETEANYCATCQTGGKLLRDRALSQILRDDWPKTVEGWEALRG